MDDITPLINSLPTHIVRDRFFVKVSSMDNGVDQKQYMIAILDVIGNNFTLKRLDSKEQITQLITLLNLT